MSSANENKVETAEITNTVPEQTTGVPEENLVTEVGSGVASNKKTEKPNKKKQLQLNIYDFVSIIMAAFIIITLIFNF